MDGRGVTIAIASSTASITTPVVRLPAAPGGSSATNGATAGAATGATDRRPAAAPSTAAPRTAAPSTADPARPDPGAGTGRVAPALRQMAQEAADTSDGSSAQGLTAEERELVARLKARDAEVRRHEQAHAAAGGQYAGQPRYDYQTGPDGNRYAVGGEVSIDASPVAGDPEATVQKMRVVIRAALAPAEPSDQDRRVAQQAQATLTTAEAELRAQKAAQLRGGADAEPGQAGPAGPTPADPRAPLAASVYRAAVEAVSASLPRAVAFA